MPAIRLDYQRKLSPFPKSGAILLAVTLAAMALTAYYYAGLVHKANLWERKSSQFERTAKKQGLVEWMSAKETSHQSGEIKRANTVLHQLTLPWDRLFEAVEASGSKEVALLALEPDPEKGTVKIGGEAKNYPAVMDYIRALKQQPIFGNVQLQNHQIQEQDPEKPVRFTMTVDWRGLP